MTDDELRSVLADRVAAVRTRIAAACARAGREPNVTLVAVTKTVSARVAGVLPELGVPDLGENRPQELWRKAEALKHLPIRWHLIGHLQRNKVERTLPLVHMIHSADSERLLTAVSRATVSLGLAPRQVLLEVNASGEEQKHGFDYSTVLGLEPFLDTVAVRLVGLMGMAAYSDDPEAARSAFTGLRRFRDRLCAEWRTRGPQLAHLSMGMSGDFEVAVEEGSTLVRVGTALFEGLQGE